MPNLTGLDDLRDSVEALDAGEASAADIERSIQGALLSGVLTRGEVLRVLRRAASRSATTEIIARLELESVGPWERISSLLAERASAVTELGSSEAVISVADRVSMIEGPAPRPQPPTAKLVGAGSERRWVDPDLSATLVVDRKMVGQILGGRYRLERELGMGGMGTMYLASDLEAHDSPFAVTVLRPEFRSFSEALALLRAEVRVTRMLRHPHIARVYSLNSDRLGVYLVTEYLEGRTLDAHLRESDKRFSLKEASRAWVDDICAALTYAHDLDVVHGDLKPANVFITSSGRAKLRDVGLARAARTRNGRFDPFRIGGLSMAYASPEMVEGREPDPRDDVYSLACIIYTLLSGVHPFDCRSAVEARDLGFAMTPLTVFSREQNAALARALAFERTQRIPSVSALLAGLGWGASPPAGSAPGGSMSADATLPAASPVVVRPAIATSPAAAPVDLRPAVATAPAAASVDLRPAVVTAPAAVPVIVGPAVATPPAAAPVDAGPAVATPPAAAPAPATPESPTATEPESASSGSEFPLPAVDPPAPVRRVKRRGPPRIPLPPTMPTPSVKTKPRAVPRAKVSRSYLMPALIVLSLVAVGIGLKLVYRTPGIQAVRSGNVIDGSPAESSVPPSPVPSVSSSASAALPLAGSAAAAPAANPPTVADSKLTPGAGAGSSIPMLRPLPKAAAAMADSDNCPYPREAQDQGLTGTVFLVIDVKPDGRPMNTKIGKTSGSAVLDQAAIRCVEQFGRFPAPPEGSTPGGNRGIMRFKWSFGS